MDSHEKVGTSACIICRSQEPVNRTVACQHVVDPSTNARQRTRLMRFPVSANCEKWLRNIRNLGLQRHISKKICESFSGKMYVLREVWGPIPRVMGLVDLGQVCMWERAVKERLATWLSPSMPKYAVQMMHVMRKFTFEKGVRCQVLLSKSENTVRIAHEPSTSSKNLAQFLHKMLTHFFSSFSHNYFWRPQWLPVLGIIGGCASILVLIFFEHVCYRLSLSLYIYMCAWIFTHVEYIFLHSFVSL